jgi:hypothetical protein
MASWGGPETWTEATFKAYLDYLTQSQKVQREWGETLRKWESAKDAGSFGLEALVQKEKALEEVRRAVGLKEGQIRALEGLVGPLLTRRRAFLGQARTAQRERLEAALAALPEPKRKEAQALWKRASEAGPEALLEVEAAKYGEGFVRLYLRFEARLLEQDEALAQALWGP